MADFHLQYCREIEQLYPNMTEILKPSESEHFVIVHFTITEKELQVDNGHEAQESLEIQEETTNP